MKKVLISLLILSLLFVGCGEPAAETTPSPTVNVTAAPTETPSPTPTPEPTPTPTPSELEKYLATHEEELAFFSSGIDSELATMSFKARGSVMICETHFNTLFSDSAFDSYFDENDDYMNETFYYCIQNGMPIEGLVMEFYAPDGTLQASRSFPLVPEKRNPVMAYYVANEEEMHAVEAAMPEGQSLEIRVIDYEFCYLYTITFEIPDKDLMAASLAEVMATQTSTMNGVYEAMKAEIPELTGVSVFYFASDGDLLYTVSFPQK